jgi:hypothetical protein
MIVRRDPSATGTNVLVIEIEVPTLDFTAQAIQEYVENKILRE